MREPKWILVTVLLLFSGTLFAADAEPPRFALVIGNAAYDGDAALANSANDASDVAEALTSIGWKVTKLINGDRRSMNRTITEFRNLVAASSNPTAMLYYAGHGIQIGGTNYLIPVKEVFETPDDVVNDAISLQTIMNAFDDAKVSTNIVILDACRDNPFVKKNTRSLGGTRGLSVVSKSANVEGSAVLFATAPGDTAADGSGRNGVFTQALLKFLKTDISLQVLATKVTGEVKKVTGGKQTPYSSLSLSDEFFMVPASLRVPVKPIETVQFPTLAVNPATTNPNDAIRASLVLEKTTLTVQKQQVQEKNSWVGWVGVTGWSLTAVGAGFAGYGYYGGTQALAEYNGVAAGNQVGYNGARDKMDGAGNFYKMGLVVGGVGLITGIASLFLGPDTSSYDKKILEIDRKIVLLGGN